MIEDADQPQLSCDLREDSWPDLPNLRRAGRECDLCAAVLDGIQSTNARILLEAEFGKPWTQIEPRQLTCITFMNLRIDIYGQKRASVFVYFPKGDNPHWFKLELPFRLEAVAGEVEVAAWLRLPPAPPAGQTYSDPDTVQSMRDNIAECEGHEHEPSRDPSYVPRRLIDVGAEVPRLVLREHLSRADFPRYSALSYCWGPPVEAKAQLKSTKASLPDRLIGLNESEMTPVLRDAISFTRALRIPYLWVDALCVLQDGITDWEDQCSDMDLVYGNALVTLCAASSSSCREGFLQTKARRIKMPLRSKLRPSIRGTYALVPDPVEIGLQRNPFDYTTTNYEPDRYQSPLSQRGWAYQEAVVSTRNIVFGAQNVHFVCDRSIWSRGLPERRHGQEETSPESTHYDRWNDILRDYTRYTERAFTNPMDALPALSGLAALYAARLGDDVYLAGHWSGDLWRSLAWYAGRHRPTEAAHRSRLSSSQDPYVAPSWSCVGKGAMAWVLRLTKYSKSRREDAAPEAEAIEGRVVPLGRNVFGALRAAEIEIRSAAIDFAREARTGVPVPPWHFPYDDSIVGFASGLRIKFELDFSTKGYEDEAIRRIISRTSWVLLGSTQGGGIFNEFPGGKCAYGLILEPTSSSSGRFQRIGVFFSDYFGHPYLDEFVAIAETETVVVI
ncbi:heterokaryon incompatibility protein-domain-containing protein [Xylariaceae sp. FL0804]|nr:heterokaryon incompatibility protein-domain-containing protein [Xylariaceae sp. FL0804]